MIPVPSVKIITGGRGYNAWWSKEYERREADDL